MAPEPAAGAALERIRDRVGGVRRVVFVTGAGVSQESGIPTFRGRDGLWRNHDAMRLATIDAFREDPKLVWEWYNDRRRNVRRAEPNPGHAAIAALEGYADVAVLTQNIDGLHQRAGSSRVLELHGSIARIRCTTCGRREETLAEFDEVPPRCGCGGMLRPDVVWFGEGLPQDVWREAVGLAGRCDMMVVAGTSLAVSPANTLPLHARRGGALMVEVNPDPPAAGPREGRRPMDLRIRDTGAAALPRLVSLFEEAAGSRL